MPDERMSQALSVERNLRRKPARRREPAGRRKADRRRDAIARQMQAVRQAQAGRRIQARAWRVVTRRVLPALAIGIALILTLTGPLAAALPVWAGAVLYGVAVIHLDWRDRTIAQEVRRLRAESRLMNAQAEAGDSQNGQNERVREGQP